MSRTQLPPEDATLGELIRAARKDFGAVAFEPVPAGGLSLEIPQVADMPAYLERLAAKAGPKGKLSLPLWAKIWPSCLVLSLFLSKIGLPEGDVLEIGAGVAVVGLSLASAGRSVTVTDVDTGALLFARIGAVKNEVADKVTVARADFTKDDLGRKFPFIVGCEVLYNEAHAAPLVDFLERHLAPGGEVILAMDRVRTGRVFFTHAQERFQIMAKEVPVTRDDGKKGACVLYRLRAKDHSQDEC